MPLPGSRDSGVVMKRVSQGSFLQRSVLKHNVIFTEGSPGEEAYLLVSGKVEISGSVDGRKKVFAILQPVTLFGEMCLFQESHARTATAIALEDSTVVVLNKDDLDAHLQSSPPAIQAVVNVLVSRLKNTTRKAMRAPNVPLGIVRVLNLLGVSGQAEIPYDAAVQHMSDIFITSTQTIEGYLHGLAEEGHIAIESAGASGPAASGRRVIRILARDLLQAVLAARRMEKDEQQAEPADLGGHPG